MGSPVTKISSCRVNTTSRRGIKQLGISFVLFFFYFLMKLTRGHAHRSWGNPQLLMTAVRTRRTIRNRWVGGGGVSPAPYMNKKYVISTSIKSTYIVQYSSHLLKHCHVTPFPMLTQVSPICKYMQISTLGKASKDTLQEKFKKLVEKA